MGVHGVIVKRKQACRVRLNRVKRNKVLNSTDARRWSNAIGVVDSRLKRVAPHCNELYDRYAEYKTIDDSRKSAQPRP